MFVFGLRNGFRMTMRVHLGTRIKTWLRIRNRMRIRNWIRMRGFRIVLKGRGLVRGEKGCPVVTVACVTPRN